MPESSDISPSDGLIRLNFRGIPCEEIAVELPHRRREPDRRVHAPAHTHAQERALRDIERISLAAASSADIELGGETNEIKELYSKVMGRGDL